MSGALPNSLSRRTRLQLVFDGVDVSDKLEPYIMSLVYTDVEEGSCDDLQITLHDRDGDWLQGWIATIVDACAAGVMASSLAQQAEEEEKNPFVPQTLDDIVRWDRVRVTGTPREWPNGGVFYDPLQDFYGRVSWVIRDFATDYPIQVALLDDFSKDCGWFRLEDVEVLPYESLLSTDEEGVKTASAVTDATLGGSRGVMDWRVGDKVYANGSPRIHPAHDAPADSEAEPLVNHEGTITALTDRISGVFCIEVDRLGWLSEAEVTKEPIPIEGEDGAPVLDGIAVAAHAVVVQASIIQEHWTEEGEAFILPCGSFEIDSIAASGTPSTVVLQGTALSFESSIRLKAVSRGWENVTLSQIATEMAVTHNMRCMFDSDVDPLYWRVEQFKVSDIRFLSQLCTDAGLALKVTNQTLVIFEQRKYEEREEFTTITYRISPYRDYQLTFGSADTKYTSCRVSYTDPLTGEALEATVGTEDFDPEGADNLQLEIFAKVLSLGEAQTMAATQLRRANLYANTAQFTFVGDGRLVAGCPVALSGFGAWDGRYMIYEAIHSVGADGYTTQVGLRQIRG